MAIFMKVFGRFFQANWKFTAHHDGVGNYQYEKQKTADRIESCLLSGLHYSIELKSIYTSSCTSLSMISRSQKIHFNLSQPTLGYLEVKGSTFQLHLSNFPWNIFKILNLETSHMMKFTRKTKKLLHVHVKFKTQDREISVNSRIIFKFHHPSVKKNTKKICNPLTLSILKGSSHLRPKGA